jgi:hypothetical protein
MNGYHFACLACALQPTLWFGRLSGLTPLSANCNKSNQPSSFHISWLWMLLSLIILTVMILSLIHLVIFAQYENIIESLAWVLECLNHFSSILLVLVFLGQLPRRIRAWNGIAVFLHSSRMDVLEILLKRKEKHIFMLAMRNFLIILICLGVQCAIVSIVVTQNYTHECAKWFFVLTEMLSFFGSNIFIFTAFDFASNTYLMEFMFKIVLNSLRKTLEEAEKDRYLVKKKFYTICNPPILMSKLCDKLMKHRHDYNVVMKSLHQLNHSYNLQLLITVSMVLFVLVVNAYMILVMLINGWQFWYFLKLTILVESIAAGVYTNLSSDALYAYVRTNISIPC